MQGRIFGIKKTYYIRATALICFSLFVTLCVLSATIFSKIDLWFFGFCISIGLFEMTKSLLFHLDSSFYLGSLTFLIGVSGFIFLLTSTSQFAFFYISLAFTLASILTFFVFKQKFHLILSYSTIFVSLYCFLFAKNLITTPILIAFLCSFLILFILEVILNIKWRR